MNTVKISFVLLVATYLGNCPTVGASNLPTNIASPADSSATKEKSAVVNRSKATSKANRVDLSGTWYFSSTWRDWHSGRITLKQTGTKLTGMWHTDVGKKEEDLPLFGEIAGKTVYLTKYMIWGKYENQNRFTLSLANGGNQLFGYGEGFFLNHADLNMARAAGSSAKGGSKVSEVAAQSQPTKVNTPDVSGSWYFTSTWRDWHKGRIVLQQNGTKLTGMWHTIDGKREEDLPLFGEVVGNTVYITKYNIWGKYENQNKFTLSLSNGGNQLFGYGEGFFLNHADLNMARADQPQKAGSKINNAVSKADEHATAEVPAKQEANETIAVLPSQNKAPDKPAESKINAATRSTVTGQEMPSSITSANQSTSASVNQNTAASATTPGAEAPQAQASAASASSAQSASTDSTANDKKEPSAEQKQKAEARANELFNQLQALVKEFYPKAQCSPSEGKLHFEYKTKDEMSYYSGRPNKAPQAGGILGEITLKPGRYDGKLLSEQQDGFHTILTLAPYSSSANAHIEAKLLFPSDVPPEFKDRLIELVNAFGKD